MRAGPWKEEWVAALRAAGRSRGMWWLIPIAIVAGGIGYGLLTNGFGGGPYTSPREFQDSSEQYDYQP